jgi:hypothetical protein
MIHTCFNSFKVKSFISCGNSTESKRGLLAGPAYGGPSAILSADLAAYLDEKTGVVNAFACAIHRKRRTVRW